MKNILFLLMMVLSITLNAQAPNLFVQFEDLDDEVLLWELTEGDIGLLTYSQYYVISQLNGETHAEELVESQINLKFFWNETNDELYQVHSFITVDDRTMKAVYIINEDNLNGTISTKGLSFKGVSEVSNNRCVVLITPNSKTKRNTISIAISDVDGVYIAHLRDEDQIAEVWYEDVINNASQQQWSDRAERN